MKQWAFGTVTYLTYDDVIVIMPDNRRMTVFVGDSRYMLPEWMRSITWETMMKFTLRWMAEMMTDQCIVTSTTWVDTCMYMPIGPIDYQNGFTTRTMDKHSSATMVLPWITHWSWRNDESNRNDKQRKLWACLHVAPNCIYQYNQVPGIQYGAVSNIHPEEPATSMDADERTMVKLESRNVPLDWVALTHKDVSISLYPALYFSRWERCPRGLMAGHEQLFFPNWMGASFD